MQELCDLLLEHLCSTIDNIHDSMHIQPVFCAHVMIKVEYIAMPWDIRPAERKKELLARYGVQMLLIALSFIVYIHVCTNLVFITDTNGGSGSALLN